MVAATDQLISDRLSGFRADLAMHPTQRVMRKHLTFGDCAMLTQAQHYEMKEAVADRFGTHPNEVYVVGSAKLGFSVAPQKRYRSFCDESDIDVALISDILFDRIWKEVYDYEQTQSSWATRGQFAKYFLRGWIRPDKLPPGASFPFSDAWFEFFRELTNSRRFGDVKISAGLYRNWKFFEGYQGACIEKCRGQELLQRVCESSQIMDQLIEDLLKLSRITRVEIQRQPVNISALAESIVQELREADSSRVVEVVIEPGLKAEGDERLLHVVLDNLLRNAWKFTGKQANAHIEVGVIPTPDYAFFIRDNGAGFDMTYAEKLFGVFQRLHSPDAFPGTGVGLAIVQRIVSRHGGRTWATGEVDKGATFYFTLPSN